MARLKAIPAKTATHTIYVSRIVANRYYAENAQGKTFLDLLKQESFSKRDLELIKELGFRVVLIAPSATPTPTEF